MVASIPASAIVNVYPSVIAAGGSGLDLDGLILTSDTRVPIGTAQAFSSAQAVADFFGPLSTEARLAVNYFLGYDNSPIKPAQLLFVQYPAAPVVPYIRGGNVSAYTLSQLRAINGTLTVTLNGAPITSGTIDLSGASSFSSAASIIQSAINHYDAVVTGSISGTTLTVSAMSSGALAVGQVLSGAGVTAGTKIVALGSGTGGTGTYVVDTSQTVATSTINAGATTVEYDSPRGAFVVKGGTPGVVGTISFGSGPVAGPLKLTAETGAYNSQGAGAANPATFMSTVTGYTQNFATFMTAFKPQVADMVALAAWTNSTLNRWAYVMWDNDATPTNAIDTTSAGYQVRAADYSGVVPLYDPINPANKAAFIMGAIASIDFDRIEGRVNLAFLSQAGLEAGVTDRTIADNLLAHGYNFYGAYATANDRFTFIQEGRITGDFIWVDSYINQIWMNNRFQLDLISLLTAVRSIPYSPAGYAMIEAALAGTIDAAVNFGAVRAGVALSPLQAAQVNQAAGREIAPTLQDRGWYLQVLPATPEVRAARGSPPVTFWYMDGQSIQKINMNSVELA